MPEKIKILLVEDDAFLSEMYSTKLVLEGYDVTQAFDGEEGIKQALAKSPELILLDILMPKMDGFEVLTKLKSDAKTQHIPVILLTNLSQKEDIDRGLKLGAVDYLIKAHFMPSEVITKVKRALGKKS